MFGNTELCHDYKEEAKRAVELYVKEKQRTQEDYEQQIKILKRQIRVRDIIIHITIDPTLNDFPFLVILILLIYIE